MKKKENKKSARTITIALIVGVFLIFILAAFKQKPQDLSQQYSNQPQIQNTNFKTHTSQDLKISFQYPKEWYVNEKDRNILIASYYTRIGQNIVPKENQIKMFIDEFSGCHPSIEENLKDPACGEGGMSVQQNKILSKNTSQKTGGTFYTYIVLSPDGKQYIYYLLQKNNSDTILQISKQPDPSQFDKEFEDIINSVKFL